MQVKFTPAISNLSDDLSDVFSSHLSVLWSLSLPCVRNICEDFSTENYLLEQNYFCRSEIILLYPKWMFCTANTLVAQPGEAGGAWEPWLFSAPRSPDQTEQAGAS